MELKIKKVSPLVVLCLIGLVIGGIGATLYWSSDPLTHTISITGWITACSNFNPTNAEGVTTFSALELACVNTLITYNGGKFVIRVASGGSNAKSCYTSLDVSLPGTSTATADVGILVMVDGVVQSGGISLGTIACDGSEELQVIHTDNPTWFYESDYSAGIINVLYFVIDFDVDPNLGIGDHTFSAMINLSDSL